MQELSAQPVQSCYEITLEKCICVARTIVSTVPPSDKNQQFPVSMNFWEKLWW